MSDQYRVEESTSQIEGSENEPQGQPAPDADIRELKRQLEHERSLRTEAEKARDLWYERSRASQAPSPQSQAPPRDPDEDFDLSQINLLDAVSENDTATIQKAIRAEAKKIAKETIRQGGFVSQAEVEEAVQRKTQEVQQAQMLMQEFPDLQRQDTPLAKETMRQLELMSNDPRYQNLSEYQQVERAALRAKDLLREQGRTQEPEPQRDSRFDRISAQQGIYQNNYSSGAQEPGLTASQRFWADALGIDHKKYKESQAKTKIFGNGAKR